MLNNRCKLGSADLDLNGTTEYRHIGLIFIIFAFSCKII